MTSSNIAWAEVIAAIIGLAVGTGIYGIVLFDIYARTTGIATISTRLRDWAEVAPWVPVVSSLVIWTVLTGGAVGLIVHLWCEK